MGFFPKTLKALLDLTGGVKIAGTDESTAIKLTAAREITATIAVQAFEAGKFNVFLYYVVGD